MTPKIILLNGPPRCGKDTAANFLRDNYNAVHLKMAGCLKRATHGLYGLIGRGVDYYEVSKDIPTGDFRGLTPREAYISVSEQYFKPVHGDDYFGHEMVKEIKGFTDDPSYPSDTFVLSDAGFSEEIQPLVDEFGARNILLIHVFREGCNFSGDSRSYIYPPDLHMEDVLNKDRIEYLDTVLAVIRAWATARSISSVVDTSYQPLAKVS